VTDASSRAAKAEERRVEAAPDAGVALAGAPCGLPAERAKAIDLEWNAELPAPPQDQVVPPPAPWRPAARAEAAAPPEIADVWPKEGPEAGGEVVVIKGRNLQPAQVLFGMVPARVLEASPEAVKVAVPGSGAGEVPIVLTNADGAYAVAMHAFRYYR